MPEEKTEQKVFEIPSSNLVSLQQTIEKWKRKGADITFDIIDKYTDKKGITYYRIVVEGGYKLEDWEFAATIEHTDNGNIIRAMPEFQGKIPEKFNDVPPYCEHCKQERNRKDTYIVYNTKTNEFKQVGRNCLEEYTGFDAREAALYASAIKEIYSITERDPYYEPESNYVSPEQFKAGAYEIVSKSGYDRDKIDGQLTSVLKLNSIDANERREARREVYNKHKDKINEIDKWVQTLANTNNDYLRNAYLAWNKPELEYRDYKLVASLISTYLKSQERAKQAEQTSYVGNVGDKVTFTVQSARVLYSKGSYSYRGPETLVYKIVDTNGNVYKWSTTSDIHEGDVITATIVEHTEYKGEKQTVITRGKIMKDSISDAVPEDKRKELRDLYNRLYDMLFEGSNGDVPENIEKAYKEVGGECGFKEKTPKYLNVIGKVGSYKLQNLISIERLYGDLNRLAEDLTMAYARNNGIDPEMTTSAFIKSLDDAVAGATPYAQRMKRQQEREAIETRLSEIEHLIDLREDFLESDEAEYQNPVALARIDYDIKRLNKMKNELLKRYNELFEQEYGYWAIGDAKKDNLNETLKAFYVREYPDDDFGEFLDDKTTFDDLRVALIAGRDVYDLMGEADDSVVRERLFSELAKRLGVKYSLIYNMWVGAPKSIRYSTKDAEEKETSINSDTIIPAGTSIEWDSDGDYSDWFNVYINYDVDEYDYKDEIYEDEEDFLDELMKKFKDNGFVNYSHSSVETAEDMTLSELIDKIYDTCKNVVKTLPNTFDHEIVTGYYTTGPTFSSGGEQIWDTVDVDFEYELGKFPDFRIYNYDVDILVHEDKSFEVIAIY